MTLKRQREGSSSVLFNEQPKNVALGAVPGQGLAARRGRTENYALDVPGTQLGPIVNLNEHDGKACAAAEQQGFNAPTNSSERNELIGFSDTPTQNVPWDDYINDLPSSKSLLDALPSPFGLQNLTGLISGREPEVSYRSPKRRRMNDMMGVEPQLTLDSPESQLMPIRGRHSERTRSPSSDDIMNRSCATPSPARRQHQSHHHITGSHPSEKMGSPGSGKSSDPDNISLAEALQQVSELKKRIAVLQKQQHQSQVLDDNSGAHSLQAQDTHSRGLTPSGEGFQQSLHTLHGQHMMQQRALLQQLSSSKPYSTPPVDQFEHESPDSQPVHGYRGRQFLNNITQQQQLIQNTANAFLNDPSLNGNTYLSLLSPQISRQLQSSAGLASPLSQLLSPLNGNQQRNTSISPMAARALGQHSPASMNSLMQNHSPTSVLHARITGDSQKNKEKRQDITRTQKKMPRMKWTLDEDEKVRQLVEKYGEGKWVSVAADLKTKNPKQVHARWRDYLRPGLKNDTPWTEEERLRLLKLHAEYGNSWSKISDMIPGRSANAIKNRINAIRRQEKAGKTDPLIERACMQSLLKPKSPTAQDQCSPSTKPGVTMKIEGGQNIQKSHDTSSNNANVSNTYGASQSLPVVSSNRRILSSGQLHASEDMNEAAQLNHSTSHNSNTNGKQVKYPTAEITPELQQHLQVELSMVQSALKLLAKQKTR